MTNSQTSNNEHNTYHSDYVDNPLALTDCATTWRPATPKQMVETLTDKLNHTSKLHPIKRFLLKRNIKFWKGQL